MTTPAHPTNHRRGSPNSDHDPKGEFHVWVKRVGNNPKIRLLLLHGGPGATHELYECFDGYLPAEGIEYIYYDQLDSYYSDQPNDPDLWTIEHFVDEVEQVRRALGWTRTTSSCLASPGAACSRPSTPWRTSSSSRA